jgi:hypothetical protein
MAVANDNVAGCGTTIVGTGTIGIDGTAISTGFGTGSVGGGLVVAELAVFND